MTTWLVTGGAGYIGAHVVRALQTAGIAPVVIDDLSSGHAGFVPESVPFVRGSILDRDLLVDTMRAHDVQGVIHVAGFKYAGVSVQRPLHTYEQNVEGTRVVLAAMADAGVHNIVFSSSAAVFGTPEVPLVTEDLPKRPTSPYGESKLIGEWLLRDQGVATASDEHPLRHTSLRYFNVVGAAAPAGTNVRDYVHVGDIAAAHVVAAQRLESGAPIEPAYNLGSQNGLSVREIMDAMARVTGIPFAPVIGPRRPGDPDRIVATGELAARDLDWRNRYTVDEMVRTGWEARRAAPTSEPGPISRG